jgi:hypothetical protein
MTTSQSVQFTVADEAARTAFYAYLQKRDDQVRAAMIDAGFRQVAKAKVSGPPKKKPAAAKKESRPERCLICHNRDQLPGSAICRDCTERGVEDRDYRKCHIGFGAK